MQVPPRPEAIDSQLVFRLYAWIALPVGLALYAWGPMALVGLHVPGLPFGRAAILRSAAAILAATGVCALGFAGVTDPISRRNGLAWFAGAHIVFGLLFLGQWIAIFSLVLPPVRRMDGVDCRRRAVLPRLHRARDQSRQNVAPDPGAKTGR